MARSRTLGAIALALLVGSLAGLAGSTAIAPSATAFNETEQDRTEEFEANFPEAKVNESGQTYGPVQVEDVQNDTLPDLILVMGDSGKEGYVDSRALYPDPSTLPTSREEALKWNEEHAEDVEVPVFESDGVTQIDVYTVVGTRNGSG